MVSTVEFHRVRRAHDNGVVAVRDVDLRVERGEFVVVLGPSGCGKTTLLRLIAGLDEPSAGIVALDGRDATGVRPQERNVAMVFQEGALYPHMTVAENLGFPLRNAGERRRRIRRRVAEVAELFGLVELVDRKPHQLSGGQRQRVAIGRSLMRDPGVLLMDEPMSNLDAKQRVERRSEIVFLHRRSGTTTIYVTHDQTEAMTMADRIVLMRHGRIVQQGTPDQLYHRPRDLFVARFIGAPAMNLLAGTLRFDHDGVVLSLGSHELSLGSHEFSRGLASLGARVDVDRPVSVGVRPEDLVPDPAGPFTASVVHHVGDGGHLIVSAVIDAPPVDVDATTVEATDEPETGLAHFANPGRALVRYLDDPNASPSRWEPVSLRLEVDRLHLFDPVTGESIADRASAAVA
ncbi:MAG: ABC transporter ATP-binding protein [Actinomycetota bacterium]